MKITIVDTSYAAFLARFYEADPELAYRSYDEQLESLINACFGTSDFYSRHLNKLGCVANDLIVNCEPLQKKWAQDWGVNVSNLALRIPHRMFRLPLIGKFLANLPGLMEVAVAQIKLSKPDVIYCQDLSFFPPSVLKELKKHVKLVVGQIACPLPPKDFVREYDLILTSFPHFVETLREQGVRSEYFKIGFDERVLSLLNSVKKDIDFSFVGGVSRHHEGAIPLMEYLAHNVDSMRFFGYGADRLSKSSVIRQRHGGEVWGLNMYEALARSRITLNRHINVAQNCANNMRLYEATGMGAMLLTDRKDNLHELFDIGKEVLAYSSKEEAVDLVRYYLEHPFEAEEISKAGQARTLRDHTYSNRMQELVPILKKHLHQ